MASVSNYSLPPLRPQLRPAPLPTGPAAPVVRWATELGEAVQTATWLPDRSAVLCLTAAGRVLRLRAADGQPTWGHDRHGNGAVCLSVCPCGALAATGHLDGTLRLRPTLTGHSLSTVRLGFAWVEQVSWSPDGQWLAASSGQELHLLDGTGRRLSSRLHTHSIDSLSWQPDSRGLAVVSGAVVQLWEVRGPAPALEPGPVLAGGQPVAALAWNPTGGFLAAGLPKGRVGGWRLPQGQPVPERRMVGCPAPVAALSWLGGGQWLAAAHGAVVAVWDAEASGLRAGPRLLTGLPLPVQYLAGQPHGALLAATDAGGTLALWQPAQPAAPLSKHLLGSPATTLHWMANGCCLAVGTAGGRVVVLSAPS